MPHIFGIYKRVGGEQGCTMYVLEDGIYLWVKDDKEAIFSATVEGINLTYFFTFHEDPLFQSTFETMKKKFIEIVYKARS